MRPLRLAAGLVVAAAGAAPAQLALTQQQEKLLLLAPTVRAAADSATSVAVMDAARDKLASLARYKVLVIPKPKMCEALQASGFPCDALLEESQGRLLARFFSADAFTSGVLERRGTALIARVHVVDIGGSGFAATFSEANGNLATPRVLGEAIAARLNTIIRAGEHARDCTTQRQRGAFPRALDAARKAFAIEPNLAAAHLCIATVYEAQRMPPDSLIAAAWRAVKGDTLNATAWETIARQYQVKGDTLKAIDAFISQLSGEPGNTRLRLGIAQLLFQHKQYQRAVNVLEEGLASNPSDQAMIELKNRICIDGELWRCALDGLTHRAEVDSGVLADSTFLKTAIGAAQQLSDTQALLRFSWAATQRFPKSAAFWKTLGAAFELAGGADSAVWAYRKSLAIDPSDLASTLLVAKALIDQATYDTAAANRLKGDTASLRVLREGFARRLDTARVYLDRALASNDTIASVNAAAFMGVAGEKLVRAAAFEQGYVWLDRTLQIVARRTPADTLGLRQRIRVNASFWFGLASVQTLVPVYQAMVKAKDCGQAKAINDRIARTKEALILGARIHPPTANSQLQTLQRYFEDQMPRVKQAFKCTNF